MANEIQFQKTKYDFPLMENTTLKKNPFCSGRTLYRVKCFIYFLSQVK